MRFVSTRLSCDGASASEAVARGVAEDGGLYVPLSFPILTSELMASLRESTFVGRMTKILSLYLDDIPEDEISSACMAALRDFDEGDECPLIKTEEGLYTLDLTCGGTARAEDVALGVCVRLTAYCRLNRNLYRKLLYAYCGRAEIGRTLLAAAQGVDGVAAVALASSNEDEIKLRGVLSQSAGNAAAFIVGEDFDGALSRLMKDKTFKANCEDAGYDVVRSNGANVLRVLPYVAVVISAYLDLADGGEIEMGQPVNIALPTLDLSLAIAACYAKQMGLPIKKIILATNANCALVDLVYDGEFSVGSLYRTLSPELDVAAPDNLERLVFELTGRDGEVTESAMKRLLKDREFKIDVSESTLGDALEAGWADEDDVKETTFNFFDVDDYALDAHTAVVASVFNDYSGEMEDDTPAILVAAVDPFVDPMNTLNALGSKEKDPLRAATKLENITALECPPCVSKLYYMPSVKDVKIVDGGEIGDEISAFLKGLN